MIAAIALRLGIGQGLVKAGLAGLALLAIVGLLLWMRADAYNDGVKANDAKWVAASQKLKDDAAKAAGSADTAAAKRAADFAAGVADEKEKLDEAERTGASPLDVLFGGGGNSL